MIPGRNEHLKPERQEPRRPCQGAGEFGPEKGIYTPSGDFCQHIVRGRRILLHSGPRPAQLRDCGRRSHGVTRTRQAPAEGIKHTASSSAGQRKGRSPAPTRPSPTQRCPPCEGVSSPLHGDLRLGQSTRRTQNKQREGGESVGTMGRPARAAALGPFPTRALGLQSRVGTAGSCRSHKAIVQPQGQGRGGGRGECGRRPRPKSSGIRGLFSQLPSRPTWSRREASGTPSPLFACGADGTRLPRTPR